MSRLVALTGLPGAGKSTAAKIFTDHGFEPIYFGGLVVDQLKQQGREVNEANEKELREALRAEHGMAAFAILSLPKIEAALEKGDVIIDDMYSWEEYIFLREKFPFLETLAVYAPPITRYQRLKVRTIRPLDKETAQRREVSQIEKLNQAGPIAMADWTFMNTESPQKLKIEIENYIQKQEAY